MVLAHTVPTAMAWAAGSPAVGVDVALTCEGGGGGGDPQYCTTGMWHKHLVSQEREFEY